MTETKCLSKEGGKVAIVREEGLVEVYEIGKIRPVRVEKFPSQKIGFRTLESEGWKQFWPEMIGGAR